MIRKKNSRCGGYVRGCEQAEEGNIACTRSTRMIRM
jgi:hypothetical protein